MPRFIHDRAEHISAKNPSMSESEAWAIATQQSHALGKSPKGYGTAQSKREAKAKYPTPKDDKKTANPGNLESAKIAFMRVELEKVANVVTQSISKVRSSPLLHDLGSAATLAAQSPTATMTTRVPTALGKSMSVDLAGLGGGLTHTKLSPGVVRGAPLSPGATAATMIGRTPTQVGSSALVHANPTEAGARSIREGWEALPAHRQELIKSSPFVTKGGMSPEVAHRWMQGGNFGRPTQWAAGGEAAQHAEAVANATRSLRGVRPPPVRNSEMNQLLQKQSFVLPPIQPSDDLSAAVAFRRALAEHWMEKQASTLEGVAAAASKIPGHVANWIGRARGAATGAATGAAEQVGKYTPHRQEFMRGVENLGGELGKVKGQAERVVGPITPASAYAKPMMDVLQAHPVPEAASGINRYMELMKGTRAKAMKEQLGKIDAPRNAVNETIGGNIPDLIQRALSGHPMQAAMDIPTVAKSHAEGSLYNKAHAAATHGIRQRAQQEASDVFKTRALTGGAVGATALGAGLWGRKPQPPVMSSSPNEYNYASQQGMVHTAEANPYLLDQIGKPKIRPTQAVAPDPKYRIKQAFETSMYSGELGPYPGPPRDKFLPPFRAPQLKTAGPPSETEGKKMAAMREELEKLNAFSPASQLNSSQKAGVPKTTAPPGPSIADISKPVGYGMPLAGATKSGTV